MDWAGGAPAASFRRCSAPAHRTPPPPPPQQQQQHAAANADASSDAAVATSLANAAAAAGPASRMSQHYLKLANTILNNTTSHSNSVVSNNTTATATADVSSVGAAATPRGRTTQQQQQPTAKVVGSDPSPQLHVREHLLLPAHHCNEAHHRRVVEAVEAALRNALFGSYEATLRRNISLRAIAFAEATERVAGPVAAEAQCFAALVALFRWGQRVLFEGDADGSGGRGKGNNLIAAAPVTALPSSDAAAAAVVANAIADAEAFYAAFDTTSVSALSSPPLAGWVPAPQRKHDSSDGYLSMEVALENTFALGVGDASFEGFSGEPLSPKSLLRSLSRAQPLPHGKERMGTESFLRSNTREGRQQQRLGFLESTASLDAFDQSPHRNHNGAMSDDVETDKAPPFARCYGGLASMASFSVFAPLLPLWAADADSKYSISGGGKYGRLADVGSPMRALSSPLPHSEAARRRTVTVRELTARHRLWVACCVAPLLLAVPVEEAAARAAIAGEELLRRSDVPRRCLLAACAEHGYAENGYVDNGSCDEESTELVTSSTAAKKKV